jgi:3-oxoacyl-[acyl-carrier-protein] synthase-3
MNIKARITGLSSYLPESVLSNRDLEKMVDTSDEWILTRTGIKERRIARSDEYSSSMGFEASKKALIEARLNADELDMILVATMTPDYISPSTAALIQSKLQAEKAAACDLQAACTGFIYALSVAKAYVESGIYNHVLVVASDKMSSLVDYKDRNTCVLFGDGAVAAVVSNTGDGLAIDAVCLGADGNLAELLMVPAGGSKQPATEETVSQGLHYLKMAGKEVFKHAVRRMGFAANESLKKAGLTKDDISWVIPHQANLRIIDAIGMHLSIPSDKIYKTLHKFGNTSGSSVGIALHHLIEEKGLSKDERVLMVAFGAGLTWGSLILTKL